MAKKGYNYFDAFVQMAQYSCEAAEYLVETLHNFDIHEMEERVTGLHEIENAADGKRHEITSHLIHEFITPSTGRIFSAWCSSWTRLWTPLRTF